MQILAKVYKNVGSPYINFADKLYYGVFVHSSSSFNKEYPVVSVSTSKYSSLLTYNIESLVHNIRW